MVSVNSKNRHCFAFLTRSIRRPQVYSDGECKISTEGGATRQQNVIRKHVTLLGRNAIMWSSRFNKWRFEAAYPLTRIQHRFYSCLQRPYSYGLVRRAGLDWRCRKVDFGEPYNVLGEHALKVCFIAKKIGTCLRWILNIESSLWTAGKSYQIWRWFLRLGIQRSGIGNFLRVPSGSLLCLLVMRRVL